VVEFTSTRRHTCPIPPGARRADAYPSEQGTTCQPSPPTVLSLRPPFLPAPFNVFLPETAASLLSYEKQTILPLRASSLVCCCHGVHLFTFKRHDRRVPPCFVQSITPDFSLLMHRLPSLVLLNGRRLAFHAFLRRCNTFFWFLPPPGCS